MRKKVKGYMEKYKKQLDEASDRTVLARERRKELLVRIDTLEQLLY